MSDALRGCALLCALACLAHACTDPGCIRNSECQANFRCLDAICVGSSGDAGVVRTDTTNPKTPTKPSTSSEDAGRE